MEFQVVYVDGWKIAGCLVNGFVVKVSGKMVVVVWYVVFKDIGEVKVVFLYDSGVIFEVFIQVDYGKLLG